MKLSVNNLSMAFDKQVVLDDVSFSFESGKIYALLGRNGSGKTTFFNCLAGHLKPQSMQALLSEGEETAALNQEDIGFVVSTPNVPEFLTGREFLQFMIDMYAPNKTKRETEKEIEAYFDYLEIDDISQDKLLKDYSHGMKNKMQLIVNIIAKPKVLFLDEPLTTLDVVMAEKMKQLIKDLKKDYIVIFSTHIMELALDLCDEVVLLHKGKMEHLDLESLEKSDQKDRIIASLSDENHHV